MLSKLPIRRIDFSKRAEKEAHDRIVQLVKQMIDGTALLQSVHSDAERETAQNNLASADRKLNALVYELYGIAKADQQAIEEGTAPKQVTARKGRVQATAPMVAGRGGKPRLRKQDLQPALF